jgi:hypothetical protein
MPRERAVLLGANEVAKASRLQGLYVVSVIQGASWATLSGRHAFGESEMWRRRALNWVAACFGGALLGLSGD